MNDIRRRYSALLAIALLWGGVGCGDDGVPDSGLGDGSVDRAPSDTLSCLGCRECEDCVDGACVPKEDGRICSRQGACFTGECCRGCWDGTTCQPGTEASACGSTGLLCTDCGACGSDSCDGNRCLPTARAIDLSAGAEHTCAVREDGAVFCWGLNITGAVGVGRDQDIVPIPARVELPIRAVQVSAGDGFTCAVGDDKSRWCWGDNEHGQLGLGDFGFETSREFPERLSGDSGWASVDLGDEHGCGLSTEGELLCWGANGQGQLGLGGNSPAPAPTRVNESEWTAVSSGSRHTCAIQSSGVLFCWGDNASAQLGLGRGGIIAEPTQPAEGIQFVEVSAGGDFTQVVTITDVRYVFGENDQGQLGTGDRYARTRPQGASNGWTQVSAGPRHGCGIQLDNLLCWGEGSRGQLGNGPTRGSDRPLRVGPQGVWLEASVGDEHSCALEANGSIWCWGAGDGGRLGFGDLRDRRTEERVCLPATADGS